MNDEQLKTKIYTKEMMSTNLTSLPWVVFLILKMIMIPHWSDAFQWSGSLDSKTGLANSIERSEIAHNSNIETIQCRAHELFSNYPKWLVRKRVTFGSLCLRERAICDSLFGSKLLIFDSFPSYDEESENSVGKKVHFLLPISGGGLANRGDNRQSEADFSFGSLQFTLTESNSKNQETQPVLELETRVVGFKSAIAGSAPVGKVRKLIYLSSQRLVHAYVMWRYHRYISSELSRIKSPDEIKTRQTKKK